MEFNWRFGLLVLVGTLCVNSGLASLEIPAESMQSAATSAYGSRSTGGYGNSSYGGYGGHGQHSPWAVTPDSYSPESYGGNLFYGGHGYSSQSVYASYLNSRSYDSYSQYCSKSYGQSPKISYTDLNNAFAYALHEVNQYSKLEQHSYSSGNYMNASTYSASGRSQIGSYISRTQPYKEKEAMFMEYASMYLRKHNCLSKIDVNYILPNVRISAKTGNPYGDNSCYNGGGAGGASGGIKCHDSKYRTIDGSCNNLYKPYWGKSHVCHLRLVAADYKDGIQYPRVALSGKELPNARVVSTVAAPDIQDHAYYTHLKMAFGQYFNHDITFTPVTQSDYGSGVMIKCCPNPANHPQCWPIHIPTNDYYLGKYKHTCMNFVRSAPCPLCTLGPRQQKNIITSFADNSALYGSTAEDSKRLRSYSNGMMRTGRDKYGREIMPPTNQPWQDQCSAPYKGMHCFDAGDPRVNQQPPLMALHVMWIRRHNQHARALYRVNPKWDDEYLYQEARRLVVAEFQRIIWGEYMQIIFGPHLMKYFNLDVKHSGYSYYEPHTDPTTWNDYATAACRFGHSQINGFCSLIGYHGVKNTTYASQGGYRNNSLNGFYLRDWYFDPALTHEGWNDQIMNGLLHDHSSTVDPWITNDVKNYLYRVKGEKFGLDLPALNIQRGRDHGLPGYTHYLEFCFGYKAYSWSDLGKFIPEYQLKILMSLYEHYQDVDLWMAGVSEKKYPGADVGPTFACILGIQYYHLKHGDRYFFSHGGQTGSFTPAQLENIREVSTLSNIICKTADYPTSVQKEAFFPASSYNPKIPCKDMPEINYNLYKKSY